MLDGITLGTGNSRYLKSISDFLSFYPTYESFAQALIAGTLPIDFNGKNPEGWAQQGTPLNKANLMTDATAALLELESSDTVNDALAALASKAVELKNKTESLEGTTPISKGGTGATTQAQAKVNLGIPTITYGTSALTAGSSTLATGTVYLRYE